VSGYATRVARHGGWRRTGRKRFRYLDARGREVADADALDRIRSLAIPPAWRDVWISPSPRAKLQATGIDAAGRKQYLYHSSYRAAREREKFERLLAFADALPALRARMERHLELGPYERAWACAIAVGVVNKAWFRVGSERHARSARTYGVTTLRKRHVSVEDDAIAFCFHAKNRKLVRRTLRSAPLARGMRELLALPDGTRLFRYAWNGGFATLTSSVLNDYLGEHMDEDFTAKDFRTWGGTLLAAAELERRGPTTSEAEARRVLASVMSVVGDELGNTPAVARESYVSPAVSLCRCLCRRPDHGICIAAGRGGRPCFGDVCRHAFIG
jgi:DNA topoisomerase-1